MNMWGHSLFSGANLPVDAERHLSKICQVAAVHRHGEGSKQHYLTGKKVLTYMYYIVGKKVLTYMYYIVGKKVLTYMYYIVGKKVLTYMYYIVGKKVLTYMYYIVGKKVLTYMYYIVDTRACGTCHKPRYVVRCSANYIHR